MPDGSGAHGEVPLLTSTATVPTDSAARYAKQLLAHLGRKAGVEPVDGEPDGGRLSLSAGTGIVRPRADHLVMEAIAPDAESLAVVEDVLGRHLERFGARRELTVSWQRSTPAEDGTVRVVHTENAPAHAGPVPQAVEAGGWIYVSALFGAAPADRAIPDDATAEAEQLFDNLEAILGAAGARLDQVVRVGVVMRHLQRDRPAFNAVWTRRFGDHRPARSAIEATDFGRPGESARYMIEACAFRG